MLSHITARTVNKNGMSQYEVYLTNRRESMKPNIKMSIILASWIYIFMFTLSILRVVTQ